MWHHGYRRHRRRMHRFGPWGQPGRFFGPGEVRLALLSLLEGGGRHGYELMKALEERSGGLYRASAGTVYPTLQQLEDEGLIGSEKRDGKRVFELTAEGRQELEAHGAEVRRIWRRAEEWGDWGHAFDPDAAELARPAFRVVKAAFRAGARGEFDAATLERVREILDDASERLDEVGRAARG